VITDSGPKFIVDINVGKLARLLRMQGYDAVLFGHDADDRMIRTALDEDRVMVTRDTQIMRRRVVTSGRLKAVLITSDRPDEQARQVTDSLGLSGDVVPLTRCLECNRPLEPIGKSEVADRVPPYVFKTQDEYARCPACGRIYWKGTHFKAMTRRLEELASGSGAAGEEV
jgi:uncharacterized protein with PIN domain